MINLYSLILISQHDLNPTRYIKIGNFLHDMRIRYELNTKLAD